MPPDLAHFASGGGAHFDTPRRQGCAHPIDNPHIYAVGSFLLQCKQEAM
jgi:hypothetical protein